MILSLALCAFVPTHPPTEATHEAIVNVRVVTADDSLGVLEDGVVVFEDGEIVAVGPKAETAIPADARIHEGLGRTVLPGLFDLHVHLDGGGTPRLDRDPERAGRRGLAFGVTAVLDLNGADSVIFALRERELADPRSPLPRIFASGSAFTVEGGHGTQGDYPARIVGPGADPAAALDELAGRGPAVVKIMIDSGGFGGEPQRPTLSDGDLKQLIELAHARGLRVAVHAVEVERAMSAVRLGADILTHLPFVGELDDAALQVLVERKTVVLPTLAAYSALIAEGERAGVANRLAKERGDYFTARLPAMRDALLRMFTHGVTLLPGSDAGSPGNRHGEALLLELEEWRRSGLPAEFVLLSATRGAAQFLGVGARAGRIAPGFVADLLLVDGNPLLRAEDLRRTVTVWKAGASVPREAIDDEGDAAPALPFLERRGWLDFEDFVPIVTPLGEVTVFTAEAAADEEARAFASIVAERDEVATRRFLRIEGVLSERVSVDVKAGVACDGGARLPSNACGDYSALRLRARGTGVTRIRVMLLTAGIRDGDWHTRTIVIGPEFTTFELPFRDFTQVGFGDRRPLDLEKVIGFTIATENDATGTFRIDIDDVELAR